MSQRKCGFCKQIGHNRRSCPAFITSEYLCKIILKNDYGSIVRNVGWSSSCECHNCNQYRKYNVPTPEIACQIIKDQELAKELAKELEKKENEFPYITIKNEMRTPIYLYSSVVLQKLTKTIESEEEYTIKYDLPFYEDEIYNFIITDHYYGDSAVSYSAIDTEHVLKFITMKYGMKEIIIITSKELSKEDQWREAALKSQYLLSQLERLGATNNPNYEPIMDMVQDIEYPEYSEQDKERAGISSVFTNVHSITGINEVL
jgi:hypothetical protein